MSAWTMVMYDNPRSKKSQILALHLACPLSEVINAYHVVALFKNYAW